MKHCTAPERDNGKLSYIPKPQLVTEAGKAEFKVCTAITPTLGDPASRRAELKGRPGPALCPPPRPRPCQRPRPSLVPRRPERARSRRHRGAQALPSRRWCHVGGRGRLDALEPSSQRIWI